MPRGPCFPSVMSVPLGRGSGTRLGSGADAPHGQGGAKRVRNSTLRGAQGWLENYGRGRQPVDREDGVRLGAPSSRLSHSDWVINPLNADIDHNAPAEPCV